MHIQSVNYTSPQYHEKMKREVGRWKYPVISSLRKGWFRPYHSQVYLDDFRVPGIIAEQFAKDMNYMDESSLFRQSGMLKSLVRVLFSLIKKLGPWGQLNKADKQMYEYTGWRCSVLLGKINDNPQLCQHDKKYKEVL